MCQYTELTKRIRAEKGLPPRALTPEEAAGRRVVLCANGRVLGVCVGNAGEVFRTFSETLADLRVHGPG